MLRHGASLSGIPILVGLFALAAVAKPTAALQLLNQSPQGVTARIASEPQVLTPVELDGRQFQAFPRIDGARIGKAGAPALPAQTQWIALPAGMSATLNVQVQGVTEQSDVTLAPFPALGSDNPNASSPATLDHESYSLDEIQPAVYASLSEPILIGSTRYVVLTVSSYRYNAARKTLYHAAEINTDIRFTADQSPRSSRVMDTPAWREVARAISNDPVRDELRPREDRIGHLVIIIPDNDQAEEAIAPLVEWKSRKGYEVTVARLNHNGIGDTREEIFGWLENGWNNWPYPQTHVLLVGDSEGDLVMPFWTDGLGREQSWHVSDNQFGTYEGERAPEAWLPEAFIGRLPTATITQLNQAVEKILDYEATPYHDQPWVEGAVLIGDGVHSCIETNVAVRELMLNAGYMQRNIHETLTEYFLDVHADHDLISQGVDNGVGFVNFRGFNNWGDYSTNEIHSRRNGMMMPVVTGMVCGTCDFPNVWEDESIGEAWVRAYNQNQPSGAIACWGPTDLYTHTWFNNSLDAEFYHALLARNVHTLGALTYASKLSLIRNYPSSMDMGNGNTVGYYLYTYTLLGDPSLQVWSHEPRPITAEFQAEVPRGNTALSFTVLDNDNAPVPGAYVHVYLRDNFRFGGYSDESGQVSLSVPPLVDGTYKLTVTGPNLVPFMDEFSVAGVAKFASLSALEYNDDMDGASQGNADDLVNPAEIIELYATYGNSGTDTLAHLTGHLETSSPFVEIRQADADFGRILPGGGDAAREAFVFAIAPETPHGTVVEFTLTASDGNDRYVTSFSKTVNGYQLRVTDQYFQGAELEPGGEGTFVVELTNYGMLDAEALTGTLYCLDPSIQIRRAEASFAEIAIGSAANNGGQPFQILAGQHAYLGSTINFGLLLADENGRRDSLVIPVQIGEGVPEAPQGPDKHGYWAYDNRDESSGLAPVYERVTGSTDLRLFDENDSESPIGLGGEVTTIDLPFDFVFYGETFRRMTISTNGWAAFAESEVVGWNNLELGSSYLPGGMIAPYWDDLYGGSVYTRYDANNARFIIEWRDFSSIVGNIRMSVVLYDPTVVPTLTGDGEIWFQYIELPEMQGRRDTPNEPATIGICSPDRSDKIEIAHAWDIDPRTSGLHSEMAVRFTTGINTEVGSLEGHVYDLTDGQPMNDVRVEIEGSGSFTLTDADGYYRMDGIPEGTYTVAARMRYFNTARAANTVIRTGETARADMRLSHPTFDIDADRINAAVEADSTFQTSFHIWNQGNGPLDYEMNIDYESGNRDEPWSVKFEHYAGDISGDSRLRGVTFLDGEFYVSGPEVAGDFPHKLYVINRNGELVRSFNQHTVDSTTSTGYLCLDRRGNHLLGLEQGNIVEITKEGALAGTTQTPFNPSYSVVWAPERGTFFTKSISGMDFSEINAAGDVLHRWRAADGVNYNTYGFAWYPEDPDGYPLYLGCNLADTLDYGTLMTIMKANPDNGEVRFVRAVKLEQGDRLADIDITKEYDPLYWTLTMLVSGVRSKRLVGLELAPNLSWISIVPDSGSVAAGARQTIDLTLRSVNMPSGSYDVVLNVIHNAEGDQFDLPISFVVAPRGVSLENDPLPTELKIEKIYPNPFNGVARIGIALPQAASAVLRVYDLTGRELQRLSLGRLPAGRSEFSFNAEELPAGLYLLKLEAESTSTLSKAVLVR